MRVRRSKYPLLLLLLSSSSSSSSSSSLLLVFSVKARPKLLKSLFKNRKKKRAVYWGLKHNMRIFSRGKWYDIGLVIYLRWLVSSHVSFVCQSGCHEARRPTDLLRAVAAWPVAWLRPSMHGQRQQQREQSSILSLSVDRVRAQCNEHASAKSECRVGLA